MSPEAIAYSLPSRSLDAFRSAAIEKRDPISGEEILIFQYETPKPKHGVHHKPEYTLIAKTIHGLDLSMEQKKRARIMLNALSLSAYELRIIEDMYLLGMTGRELAERERVNSNKITRDIRRAFKKVAQEGEKPLQPIETERKRLAVIINSPNSIRPSNIEGQQIIQRSKSVSERYLRMFKDKYLKHLTLKQIALREGVEAGWVSVRNGKTAGILKGEIESTPARIKKQPERKIRQRDKIGNELASCLFSETSQTQYDRDKLLGKANGIDSRSLRIFKKRFLAGHRTKDIAKSEHLREESVSKILTRVINILTGKEESKMKVKKEKEPRVNKDEERRKALVIRFFEDIDSNQNTSLSRKIDFLNDRQLAILRFHYLEGKTFQEIADIFRVKAPTIIQQRNVAIEILQNKKQSERVKQEKENEKLVVLLVSASPNGNRELQEKLQLVARDLTERQTEIIKRIYLQRMKSRRIGDLFGVSKYTVTHEKITAMNALRAAAGLN